MLKNLLIVAALLPDLISQSLPDPDVNLVWTLTETSYSTTCPNVSGSPRISRSYLDAQLSVSFQCPYAFVVENLQPNDPFVLTYEVGVSPNSSGCVWAANNILLLGIADQNGRAVVNIVLDGSTIPFHFPIGLSYFGMMQIISFSSTALYSTSNPIEMFVTI